MQDELKGYAALAAGTTGLWYLWESKAYKINQERVWSNRSLLPISPKSFWQWSKELALGALD